MSLRRIPGTSQSYHLISFDGHGDEVRDADGTIASEVALAALTDPAAGITDVFILSHGWQGDYDDAISQYDRWLGAANPDGVGDGIRPFVIGVHWPSKAWSDRELEAAPSGLLGDEPPAGGMSVADAVDEYAAAFGDSEDVREALTTVLQHAADTDPRQAIGKDDALPTEVTEAYRTLAAHVGANDSDDSLLGGGWTPDDAFEAVKADRDGDDGLLGGGGFFRKLRDALLTPLRQLAFWHGKNQAREFGERGGAQLLRAILAATAPAVRVHLMGHSFGTIVVSSAVRGPGDAPSAPARPVTSMFLVQGAVSLWAFAEHVPDGVGGGRGYLADVVRGEFVSGPIVATTSKWDYAVGRFYPLAVGIAGQYLLGDELPKYGGIGTFGIQGAGAVDLPDLVPGSTSDDTAFRPGTVYNIDASQVIHTLDGASGAHNDLAHAELSWLGWRAALVGVQRPGA
ncbi:hypothetical protein [Microbacterium rhizomatis]|uniref:Serine-threonine protein kinase n=1 Tax=Microbacterium rhizomatis TaxID=1631477 RepID=A0A5J5J2N4_9MICO|nr:hypothetical protein [Microbacterium rhizomatis]KAA9110467.1 hypothetical protein F6B43_01915 [Microbacterium rhizomatis]